jgi:phosphoribosylamine---glycine ligase
MNILILGSGGREHALQWIVNKSPSCNKVYISPGNGGTFNNVDFSGIRNFITSNEIDLVIVGPEKLLADGIVDEIDDIVTVIGPNKKAARLEWDKLWAKEFMIRHDIPTPKFASYVDYESALKSIMFASYPLVIKASGLAAGKGVVICNNFIEANKALENIIVNKCFGEAGNTVIIEEFINGLELSYFVLLRPDQTYAILPEAMDYKQFGENDKGPNTGGMGAISPVPFCKRELREQIEKQIVQPTLSGLAADNIKYSGFIYFGLILKDNKPYLLEYNCRLGDPETQVILPRITSDFIGTLLGDKNIEISDNCSVGVVLASKGYPISPVSGDVISGLGSDKLIFHGGTKKLEEAIMTNGGRVLTAVGISSNLEKAIRAAYKLVGSVDFCGKYFRRDIGECRLNRT